MKPRADALFGAAAMLLSLAAAVVVLELWNADLNVPFADTGDATLNLFFIKDVLENAWYFENPRLGAPQGLELYDYPVVNGETLNLLLFHLLRIGSDDPALVMNLFFLLTFPLTGLTAFLVLRRLGAERWAALVCAVLYAVLPYHFIRGEHHLFLAAYYVVPIGAYLAVAVLSGEELLGRRRRTALTIGLAALVAVASGSFYYSAFTVVLVAAAALLRFVATRDRRAFLPAAVVVGVVLAVSLVQLIPTLAYRAANGSNEQVAKRFTFESEVYSLKLTQLVLPLDEHRVEPVGRIKRRYSSRFPAGDATAATLGAVATLGFLWLLAVALAALVGRRPRGRHPALAALALVSLLFAMTGGLGVLAGLVWAQTRAWNRLSVFIAFFALAAVALGLGALGRRVGRPPLYAAILAVVLVVGVLDQTSSAFTPNHALVKGQWRHDRDFFRSLEARLSDGAMVVHLPYEPFPEPPPGPRPFYEPAKPYLHTDDLRWSYGAMRGRPADWLGPLADRSPSEIVLAATQRRFAGIVVDRLGYADQGAAIEAELTDLLGGIPRRSANDRFLFWRL
jgi:hypothetical protein